MVFLSFTADYATMRRLGLAEVSPTRYLWFLALFTTSAALCLIGVSRRGSAWALALIGIQFAGLVPLALSYNSVIDARLLYPTPPALVHLQQEVAQAPGRVLMAPNLAMLYGLEGVAAYDGMTPRHLDEAIRSETSALNLLGSGYVGDARLLAARKRTIWIRYVLVPPDVALDSPGLSLRYHGVDGRIYRNEAALPRAFVAAEARCLDTAEVLKLIRARTVDFRREVLLTDCLGAIPGDDRSPRRDAPSPGTARIERYGADRIVISAERSGRLSRAHRCMVSRMDGERRWPRDASRARRSRLPGSEARARASRRQFRYAPMSVRLGLALARWPRSSPVRWRGRERHRASEASIRRSVAMTPKVAPTAARWRLTIVALAACVATWLVIAPVEASLPSPPFAVSMDVSPDGTGNRVTVRVEARPALAKAAGPEAFDLYVVQLQGFQVAVFLTTSGVWSPTPVSVQRGLFASSLAPIAGAG